MKRLLKRLMPSLCMPAGKFYWSFETRNGKKFWKRNVGVLCAVGDFGNGTFNLPLKLNSSSKAQLTTIAPIAQNTCYKLAAVFHTETSTEVVTKRI